MHEEIETIVVSEDQRCPIELTVLDYWARIFLLRDAHGDRISLAGFTGHAEMRNQALPVGELLLTFRVTLEGGDANPDKKGEVLVEALSDATADLLEPGVWDCRLTRPNSQPVQVIALSPVTLKRAVTT